MKINCLSTIDVVHDVEVNRSVWKPRNLLTENTTTKPHFRLALDNALTIISTYCKIDFNRMRNRIAPLEFHALGPNVLMRTRTLFVLENTTTALENVWTPMCLMIHRETDPVMLQQLIQNNIYDIHIDINTDIDFVIGDKDCAWSTQADADGLYSTVSVLLHELLHGLGIYSLIDAGHGDTVALYDTLFRYTSNDSAVFTDPTSVQRITGHVIAGHEITIAGHPIYNPQEFVSGVSLSHMQAMGIMQHTMEAKHCEFRLDTGSIDALIAMGWNCKQSNVKYALAPPEENPDDGTTCGTTPMCACIIQDLCVKCSRAQSVDTIVDVMLITLLIASACIVYAVWSKTHHHVARSNAKAPHFKHTNYAPINTI